MYITKRTNIVTYDEEKRKKIRITIPGIKPKRVFAVEESVAYWRYATQIHRWFVENLEDGEDDHEPHDVSKDDLENLLALCKEVKETRSKAEELLPVDEGIFASSGDYNRYYFWNINQTIKQLTAILEEDNGKCKYQYEASW